MSRLSICVACFVVGLGFAFVDAQPPPKQVDKKGADKKAADKKAADKKAADKAKGAEKAPPKLKPPEAEVPLPPPPPSEEPAGLPSPLRLVQGLREQGLADLALEYLDGLDAAQLPPADAAALPLEKAKCKLALAKEETEEGVKAAYIAEAKDELQAFIKAQAKHPQRAEANLALARLTSLEAKTLLQQAVRTKDKAKKTADKVAARALFIAASSQYAEASKGIAAQLAGMRDSIVKRALVREKSQAELDSGINLFHLYDTFPNDQDATAKDREERAKALEGARKVFALLGSGPANSPAVWLGKAWVAECDLQQDRSAQAKVEIEDILRSTGTAAEAGRRQVQYFDVERAYGVATDSKALVELQKTARAWLTKYDVARKPNPETLHVKYILARALQMEALSTMSLRAPKPPAKAKVIEPNPTERGKLTQAEKLYKEVAQTENDDTERAGDHRTEVIRRLIGDTIKPPREYAKYEDAHMAALIQMSKLKEAENAKSEAGIKAARERLIALLERTRILATPADPAIDVVADQLKLAFQYFTSGDPYQAAVLGEYLTRAAKPVPNRTSAAGYLAMSAYLTASTKAPVGPAGDESRKADRERAFHIAQLVDEKFPVDAITDEVRYKLGYLYYADGNLVDSFQVLSRIRPGFTKLVDSRLMEGLIAHQLLVPQDSKLPKEQRVKVYRQAVADLERVPPPAASAASADVVQYARARGRLCLLYLLKTRIEPQAPPAYDKAEAVADALGKELGNYHGLTPENKIEAALLAQDLWTRAIYLQAAALFEKGEYDPLFAKINPLLEVMDKSSPASAMTLATKDDDGKMTEKPLEGNLAKIAAGFDQDRRDIILLALKGRIRKGEVDEATKQLDRLEKFGGSVDSTVATLQQLLTEVRSQIEALKKEKPDEAKALTDGFSQLIAKVTGRPDLKPSVRLFAGQALLAVDRPADAAAELEKVPAPPPADLVAPFAGLPPEKKEAVKFYRAATLYRMRALRQAKQFSEADKLIAEVVGDLNQKKENPKKGWGYNTSEYRKEAYLLAEAKAQATTGAGASTLWGEAVQGWGGLAGTQRTRLTQSQNKLEEAAKKANAAPAAPDLAAAVNAYKAEVEQNKTVYFGYFFETQRCSLQAYVHVYKGKPEKVKEKIEAEARKMVDLETKNPDLASEIRSKYAELLGELKDLKTAYQAAGGKMFLQKPEATAAGGQ